MKTSWTKQHSAGFTLVELMITLSVCTLAGGLIFFVLNTGMVLFAKNTAVNVAHQQARSGIDQMLANIHGSVSVPQLVDETLTPLPAPGTGPAVGVNFQRFDAGPFLLSKLANVTPAQTFVTVYAPTLNTISSPVGLRFNIPTHIVELDITSITASAAGANYRTINFATAVGTNIYTKPNGTGDGNGNGNGDNTSNIVGFTTRRMSYAVLGGTVVGGTVVGAELRYFPTNQLSNYKVIARDVASPTAGQTPQPFKILFNQSGGADLRSVAAVDLSTAEPQYSNRGYAAVNMFISSYIPFRSKLTVFQ